IIYALCLIFVEQSSAALESEFPGDYRNGQRDAHRPCPFLGTAPVAQLLPGRLWTWAHTTNWHLRGSSTSVRARPTGRAAQRLRCPGLGRYPPRRTWKPCHGWCWMATPVVSAGLPCPWAPEFAWPCPCLALVLAPPVC